MAGGDVLGDDPVAASAMPAELVADGVSSISIRRGVAKIEFYRVTGMTADGRSEVRVPVLRVALPVAGLQELSLALRRLSDAAQRRQEGQ